MKHLKGIETFLAVAEAGSFARAARQLGLSRSAVTTQINKLEAALGVQLLNRRGRVVAPTDAAQPFMSAAAPLLQQLDALVDGLRTDTSQLSGLIRIGVPPVYGEQKLAPAVVAFLERHPAIQITLIHDDGLSALTTEGLDVSIRLMQSLESTSEVRIRLDRIPQRLVASPEYVTRRGAPSTPDDLRRHDCLTPATSAAQYRWNFTGPDGPCSVYVSGRMKANMAGAVRAAALLGPGIILQPSFLVDSYIEQGRLTPLLPSHHPEPLTVYLIYSAAAKLMPARVRAFLDFFKSWSEHPLH
ncbi:MAG: LysR substrate-binding domain-containing protein [Caulobacterales bacterium]